MDKKLENQLGEILAVAKENKKVDVTALLANALEHNTANNTTLKSRKWAYLIAIGAPPFGLLFSLYFLFSEKADAKKVALWCVFFTAISLLGLWLLSHLLLSSSGVSLEQIQQINPEQIQELYQ